MKIAIIGAGITGLYLAWKLSEKGHNVTVFEKKEKIGKEVCSGLFSERILEFIPESRKLMQNQIDYCLIHLPSDSEAREEVKLLRTPRRTLKIKFSSKFFVMNHYELDRLVASLAESTGVKIILGYNVTRKDLVTLGNERIIGCDGALSQIRKNLGLKEPQFYLGIQGFLAEEDFSNYVETWPIKFGFIWKIPRGKEIEYGVMEKPNQAKGILENFLDEKGIKIEKLNSALIPQGLIIPRDEKITLCGDAAGLVKPWSGGGVIWGLIAADILLKNFPNFLKYKKEVEKVFYPKIILSKIAKKLVYFLGFKFPWVLPKNFKIESDFLI